MKKLIINATLAALMVSAIAPLQAHRSEPSTQKHGISNNDPLAVQLRYCAHAIWSNFKKYPVLPCVFAASAGAAFYGAYNLWQDTVGNDLYEDQKVINELIALIKKQLPIYPPLDLKHVEKPKKNSQTHLYFDDVAAMEKYIKEKGPLADTVTDLQFADISQAEGRRIVMETGKNVVIGSLTVSETEHCLPIKNIEPQEKAQLVADLQTYHSCRNSNLLKGDLVDKLLKQLNGLKTSTDAKIEAHEKKVNRNRFQSAQAYGLVGAVCALFSALVLNT